jgi:hypothetical protein
MTVKFVDADDLDSDGDVTEFSKSQTWKKEFEVNLPYKEPVCKE